MTRSEQLFAQAARVIPGGVNSRQCGHSRLSAVRLYFIDRAEGAYLWDVDGKRYIDYVLSWGPMNAGHAHPHRTGSRAGKNAERPELRRAD
jgi:glutamate-1-semialdehyde 2,1-aminomutase